MVSAASYLPQRHGPTHQRPGSRWPALRLLATLAGKAVAFHRMNQEFPMLHYAVVFFVIALIAAVFGFGGIAAGAVEIGKLLFLVFAVLAVISFVVSLVRRG
jgi:uncharacterized membrane protein YtjA (UPF0391 family)